MKLVLLSLAATLSCAAQFRSIEITFQGIGCASCMESLPARVERLRGVDSATVDAEHGILRIQLAARNRVRLEQVRDMIEQDGTKVRKAAVRVQGALSQTDGKWVLQPAGLAASYELEDKAPSSTPAGTYLVIGEVAQMHPESGRIAIRASQLNPAE